MKAALGKIKENFTVHVPSIVIGLVLGVTTGTFILDLVGFGGVAQKIVERECGAAIQAVVLENAATTAQLNAEIDKLKFEVCILKTGSVDGCD